MECGPAAALLTEERLTRLYAVPVHCVEYTEGGVPRRGIVPGYGAGLTDGAAAFGPATARPVTEWQVSPGPPPGRTAPPVR